MTPLEVLGVLFLGLVVVVLGRRAIRWGMRPYVVWVCAIGCGILLLDYLATR